MDDTFMESIEPYDYTKLTAFDTAYLTGYYADRYNVPSEAGEERIHQRVSSTMDEKLQRTTLGYATVVPTTKNLQISNIKARYVLMPVWMLNTKFQGKIYTFAMNGQTGKMTGAFPICPKKTALWFGSIFAIVSAITAVVQIIAF